MSHLHIHNKYDSPRPISNGVTHDTAHGSFSSYVIGYAFSIALTLASFAIVIGGYLHGTQEIVAILTLAVVQLIVQLFFFLHLGREKSPRWNLVVLSFASLIVLILVVGSLWIMNNLDYNMMHMTPTQMDRYMQDQ